MIKKAMNHRMLRRDFLKAAPVAAYAVTQIAKGATLQALAPSSRNYRLCCGKEFEA
jgi:hypothetical protein